MITVITGFGRSGTSLLAQMLHAGGHEPTPGAKFPMYEDPVANLVLREGDARVRSMLLKEHIDRPGCFIKVLGLAGLQRLLRGLDYRFLWTERDPQDQARSWRKFRRWRGQKDEQGIQEIMDSQAQRYPVCMRLMAEICGKGGVHIVHFRQLLTEPQRAAEEVAQFLRRDDLDTQAMAACVKPRSPKVYGGMLEDELIGKPKPGEMASDEASEELRK